MAEDTHNTSRFEIEGRLQAYLAEYSSLRHENIAALGHRLQIISLGFVGLTVIVPGLLAAKELPYGFRVALLILIPPQLSKAALYRWLGEYWRIVRSAIHIREKIEKNVNSLLGKKVLTWETWLCNRGKDKHSALGQIAAVFMMSTVGYISSILGLYLLFTKITLIWGLCAAVACTIYAFLVVLCIEIVFYVNFLKRWSEVRRKDHSSNSTSET